MRPKPRIIPALLTAISLLGVSFAARAADIPLTPLTQTFADPVQLSSAVDWTGFYAGFNLGYSAGNADQIDMTAFPGAAGLNVGSLTPEGWLGGVQAGFNRQHGNLVLGLEADLGLGDVGATGTGSAGGVMATGAMDLDWTGTLAPRLGLATGPALIYAMGGVAVGGLSGTIDAVGAAGETSTLATNGDIALGYAVGGGIEYALNDVVSIKGEYRFTHLSAEARGRVFDAGGADLGIEPNSWINADTHTLKAGLNFHF